MRSRRVVVRPADGPPKQESAAADIACVNLEAPFSDRPLGSSSKMIFQAEQEMVEGLVASTSPWS